MSENAKVWDDISEQYSDEIISPFSNSLQNPFDDYLKSIKYKQKKKVLEIGCGTGPLIGLLARKFKSLTAVDYSQGMVNKAKERIESLPKKLQDKITIRKLGHENLLRLDTKFDLIISSNSIISPSNKELERIFSNVASMLKNSGAFIAILPALESVQEEYQYTFEQELKRYKSHQMAKASTNKKLEAKRIDFALGTYNTGDMIQKYFTRNELVNYLTNVGFEKIKFEKVIYQRSESYNYIDEDLTNHPPMWDWIIKASKK